MLLVGTSGFSFRDWKGVFYPEHLKPADLLSYYGRHFNAVEINTTYYGVPKPGVFERMAQSVPRGFEFVVKANKATTHDGKDRDVCGTFLESIRPLKEADCLSGVLAQFPWAFRNEAGNRRYLSGLAETYRETPLFVEFRHESWNREEVYRFLVDLGLLFVSVDEPQIGDMMPPEARATGNTAYVRFHGRNAQSWWANSADRYNYLYPPEELEEWVEKVEKLEKTVWKLYAFFNNCHQGYAVRNALMFRDMMEKRMK
ncbi:MAG: DUF72 domain-containing protein, partial [Candidatus Latescibacterota bacterium]